MKTSCKHCGAAIEAEGVDVELGFARCRYCGGITSLGRSATASAKPTTAPVARDEVIPMPKGLVVDRRGEDLSIVRRWFSAKFLFLVFFCIVWDGFLFAWYFAGSRMFDAPLIFYLFPLIHVVVGIGLTYYTICGFVNRTEINAGFGRLRVAHGPLPWPGNLEIEAGDLRQIYVKERVSRNENSVSVTYSVYAVGSDDREIKLVTGFSEASPALFVEAELESHLGIEHQPVAGSYR